MLTPEEVRSRLDAARKTDEWIDDRIKRLAGVPAELRAIGYHLIGRDADGKAPTDSLAQLRRHHGAEKVQKLSLAQLRQLGETIFWRFPEVVHAALDMFARLPVQVGYARKPFRAPRSPNLILDAQRLFLTPLINALNGYEEDLPWIAAHAGHIAQYSGVQQIGILLAAAIDLGGDRGRAIEQILRDSAAGTHDVGTFGQHVIAGLLCSANPENWAFMGKMLLAAQRQEGLRQGILESIDFAHPDAFRYMLRVIDENRLVRFSATVRAADVWLGLQLDSNSAKYVEETFHTISRFLDDPAARDLALAGDDAEQVYFALWSIAFDDSPAAIAPATRQLSHRKPEVRFISLHLLQMLQIKSTLPAITKAVDDDDPRVAAYAAALCTARLRERMQHARWEAFTIGSLNTARAQHVPMPPKDSGDLFERLEQLYARLPETAKPLKALVWPWLKVTPTRQAIADCMIVALGERPPSKLLAYLPEMSPESRAWTAKLLGRVTPLDDASRRTLLELVGDAATAVREAAVAAMRAASIKAGDLPALEPLLGRKASDLRRGVLALILSLDDAAAIASARRLTDSKNISQRLAGLDLLTQLHAANRSQNDVRAAAESFKTSHAEPSREEQVYLEKLLTGEQAAATLDDALGLMDPAGRTPPAKPRTREVKVFTPSALALLQSLDDLIEKHREETVSYKSHDGDTHEVPLGASANQFPRAYEHHWRRMKPGGDNRRSLDELPLKDLWLGWWNNRPAELRDDDNLEAARAFVAACFSQVQRHQAFKGWQEKAYRAIAPVDAPATRHHDLIHTLLTWIIAHHTPARLAGFTLDGVETLMAGIPTDALTEVTAYGGCRFREFLSRFEYGSLVSVARAHGHWTKEDAGREFALRRWRDEPGVKVARERPDWAAEYLPALVGGFANEHDLFDCLLGPRVVERHYQHGFNELSTATTSLRRGELPAAVIPIVQRAISRVLEIELVRGETETAATGPALALNYAGGSDVLIRVLQAIGKDPKLARHYSWGEAGRGKSVVFSHLIRATFPAKEESVEAFTTAVKAAGIETDALLAVAFYAPQWARFIQAVVGWPLLEEAVWWIHAHTKDKSWRIDHDTREGWNAEIRKLTPLTLEDLVEGAVDVDWFHRVYEAIGPRRWEHLDEFTKYASGGAGHARARLFAQAMLGKVKRTALVTDITKKRKQDAVRAIGLLPLDKKDPKKDQLQRYKTLQEFIRSGRKFGSMRQASEKLAARIGQENLARTAGYPDPIRLQWAMEGLASSDLAKGPVHVKVKDITVTLAIDSDGLPEVTCARKDKPLKAIPPEVKADDKVQALTERKTDLRRSASRMRQSLEQAMCRGDAFSRDELIELLGNVILRPMLERLVFIGDGVAGYPTGGGKALKDHAGKVEPIKKDETLRLAHPVDFLKGKHWTAWQKDCFAAERVQPFKQIFRELYVLTDQEKSDATFSRRYAGQQVNPRQAMALLGSRGWIAAPEAGVFRTFHHEKIVAWIEFMETFYTPAEVEGLTVEKIRFAHRGGTEYAKLADLPPRLISEVMRDVDLVVSVAHRGAVDPEASASTVELRSSLLTETLRLLKIDNVRIKAPHVLIQGHLAEYSVHLGSATVHMMPGGTLFLVPVHSQHRGRIFLPFADDDPKTAELISKVLLLARDQELRDPQLLAQIRSLASAS